MTAEQQVNNNSGGDITIQEIGFIVITEDAGSVNRFYLMIHDLISGGFTVADGEAAVIRYKVDFLN